MDIQYGHRHVALTVHGRTTRKEKLVAKLNEKIERKFGSE
jgi:hypothetical protein